MTRSRARTLPFHRHCLLTLAVAINLLLLARPAAAAKTVTFEEQEGKALTARYGDQILWQFHFAQDLPKPYFHPVALPGGSVLTWNSPPDHRWHHGLWFCWKFINGVNYWEPNQTGTPDGKTEWQVVKIDRQSDGRAVIRMTLQYRTGDAPPVLTERRSITLSPPDDSGSFHMDWHCIFKAETKDVVLDRTPLPDEPGGQPWGGYAGLSVRFAKELTDREATTEKGAVEFNAQSRFRGTANVMDYAGKIGDQDAGIAICDHPSNLHHPSPWYAIRSDVMSYFSPAVICYGPYTLKAGTSFGLRYRVIIHRDKWDSKCLQEQYDRFVAETGNGA